MITDSSVEIAAPASIVWEVFVAVERWPEWTASVERVVPLDGPALEVGRRYEIKQPRLPKVVWEVTELDPGHSWTWRQRSLGSKVSATHEVVPQDAGRTVVRQRIDQRGPLGVVVGVLMRRLTRRYLYLEGQGLKARSEERRSRNASAA
jgi:uncharacterized protein YndB with AHSA1/START domain